jgi:hypothetical protein
VNILVVTLLIARHIVGAAIEEVCAMNVSRWEEIDPAPIEKGLIALFGVIGAVYRLARLLFGRREAPKPEGPVRTLKLDKPVAILTHERRIVLELVSVSEDAAKVAVTVENV